MIHYNGAFHSDFTEDTAAHASSSSEGEGRRISAIPVESLDALDPKPLRKQGDWLLFVYRRGGEEIVGVGWLAGV